MSHARRRVPRLLLVTSLAIAAALGAPTAQAADGYEVDLSNDGDFVAQTNFVQCVGASLQMMLNVIEPGADRTASTQLQLQRMARRLSPPRPDGSMRQGASIIGWTEALNRLDAGPYRLDGTDTIQQSLRNAARAIRQTKRPVGLLMWRGRHAWVMVGFRATADPAKTGHFRVTHAIVMDPLYPHGSIWGPSPQPGEALTVAELGEQFRPRRRGNRASRWLAGYEGKYVTTLPYVATAPAAPADDQDDVAGEAPTAWRWGARVAPGTIAL